MRFTGKTKLKSFYEQTPYTVIDVKGTKYTLLSCDTRRPRQPIIRHASQIKLYQQPARTMPPHSKPAQAKPQHCDKAYDLPSHTRRRNNPTATPQNNSPAQSAHRNLVPDDIDEPPPPRPRGPAEGPANDRHAPHEIEPEISFCHPQQQTVGEGRSKTGRPRNYGKANDLQNLLCSPIIQNNT